MILAKILLKIGIVLVVTGPMKARIFVSRVKLTFYGVSKKKETFLNFTFARVTFEVRLNFETKVLSEYHVRCDLTLRFKSRNK